ncbi:hypothetical protein BaRGS_00002181 [Batillaria attramentaria]|uniref:Uncharacterized protein n=1 Tax=Batillaria attramentaria TaxID=370345 RepID=A0ABD0M5J8_9CAEN
MCLTSRFEPPPYVAPFTRTPNRQPFSPTALPAPNRTAGHSAERLGTGDCDVSSQLVYLKAPCHRSNGPSKQNSEPTRKNDNINQRGTLCRHSGKTQDTGYRAVPGHGEGNVKPLDKAQWVTEQRSHCVD